MATQYKVRFPEFPAEVVLADDVDHAVSVARAECGAIGPAASVREGTPRTFWTFGDKTIRIVWSDDLLARFPAE